MTNHTYVDYGIAIAILYVYASPNVKLVNIKYNGRVLNVQKLDENLKASFVVGRTNKAIVQYFGVPSEPGIGLVGTNQNNGNVVPINP